MSIVSVVVIEVRAESALENEADMIPKTKHTPAIGDMIVEATIGMILSGSVGSEIPAFCA